MASKQPPWGINDAFPTRFLSRDWEDAEKLNEALRSAILLEKETSDGIYRSNLAGTWHSEDKLLERLGPAGKLLFNMFGQGYMTYATAVLGGDREKYDIDIRMNAWAMVYSEGGYAAVHSHPNCHASAVYYVSNSMSNEGRPTATGVSISPGSLEFVDTRRGGEFQVDGLRFSPSSIIKGVPGRLLVFPSWLPHYVHPVVGEGERISIACNATFKTKRKTTDESDEQHKVQRAVD